MLNSGFGMDGKLMAIALLMAVGQRRVLLHVPGRDHIYKHFPNRTSGRWCDRPPYTLDCMWKPLSHCDPPDPARGEKSPDRRFPYGQWPADSEDVVRITVHWIHKSATVWQRAPYHAKAAAMRFLFRPRPWVRRLSECIMNANNLKPRQFFSVFLRISPEKEKELKKRLPPVEAYAQLALQLGKQTHLPLRGVLLQSANPESIRQFSDVARSGGLPVAYTDNPRSEHDTEGGRFQSLAMWHGVVAAVNLDISSRGALFIGMGFSMWTYLSGMMLAENNHGISAISPSDSNTTLRVRCQGSPLYIWLIHHDSLSRTQLSQAAQFESGGGRVPFCTPR